MAENQTPAFFAAALLLLTAATPLALAQAPPAIPVVDPFQPMVGSVLTGLTVDGKLCCTRTLSCPGGFPLVDAQVSVICDRYEGTVFTDFNGNFSLTLTKESFLYLSQSLPFAAIVGAAAPCYVIVAVLNDSCTIIKDINPVTIGFASITGLLLGDDGIHGIAAVKNFLAVPPV